MGWFFGYNNLEKRDVIHEVTQDQSSDGKVLRTLRKCCRGNVLYVLHESGPEGNTKKWICVYLLAKSDGVWGYKPVDEGMGPYETNCPVKYLDEADEPMNDYAREWRVRVRERAARSASKKPKAGELWKLRDGCRPAQVRITSVRPLRGEASGTSYRLPRKYLDCRVE